MTENYYEILEINQSCTDTDIVKAYRRLALRWHPDKNPENRVEAETRFKQLSEAYQVLSDKKKRGFYDRHGKLGFSNDSNSRSRATTTASNSEHDLFADLRNPHDLFEQFFGTKNILDLFNSDFDVDLTTAFRNHHLNRIKSSNNATSKQEQKPSTAKTTKTILQQSLPSISSISTGATGELENGLFSSSFFSGLGDRPPVLTSNTKSNKKVTKRTIVNGVETVIVEENGVVTSKTVNGVPQDI